MAISLVKKRQLLTMDPATLSVHGPWEMLGPPPCCEAVNPMKELLEYHHPSLAALPYEAAHNSQTSDARWSCQNSFGILWNFHLEHRGKMNFDN